MTELDDGTGGIPRDHNGWPLVPHPDGTTIKCHRPSGIAKKFLTDSWSLDQWVKRTIIKGAGLRPDLAQMAGPLDLAEDKDELNAIADEASTAGGRDAAANRGTAVHTLLERLLTGQPCDTPPDLADDIEAIRRCLAENGVALYGDWCERFVINYEVPAAGSPDAYVTSHVADGITVLDLKTGGDPRAYSRLIEYSTQLSIYAGASHAWDGTGTPLVETPELNTGVGLILWAPAGTGRAELIGVDLDEGWRLVELACEVRDSRRNPKRIAIPLERKAPVLTAPAPQVERAPERSTRADLRRRLHWLIDHTECTVGDITVGWPEGVAPLTEDNHTEADLEAVAQIVMLAEVRFRAQTAERERVAKALAAINALPADLADDVTAAAKACDPPIPHLGDRSLREIHLDMLGPIVAQAQNTAAERLMQVKAHLSKFSADDGSDLSIVEWATEGADRVPELHELTAMQAERVCALAELLDMGEINLEGLLVDLVGSKRDVLTAAKSVAGLHGLDAPRSTADVCSDRMLAALVVAGAR